jgi:hypothetical protein
MKTIQTVVYTIAVIVGLVTLNEFLTYWPAMPLAAPVSAAALFAGVGFTAYLLGKD